MSRRTTSALAALAVVPLFVALAGCATSSDAGSGDGGSENETVKIGVVG